MPEDELVEQPLSATEPCVRYNGTSNWRVLTSRDLSGLDSSDPVKDFVWSPGSEISWELWYEAAGSFERALEVLRAHSEFELVGPGAAELWAGMPEDEEFSFGGPAE